MVDETGPETIVSKNKRESLRTMVDETGPETIDVENSGDDNSVELPVNESGPETLDVESIGTVLDQSEPETFVGDNSQWSGEYNGVDGQNIGGSLGLETVVGQNSQCHNEHSQSNGDDTSDETGMMDEYITTNDNLTDIINKIIKDTPINESAIRRIVERVDEEENGTNKSGEWLWNDSGCELDLSDNFCPEGVLDKDENGSYGWQRLRDEKFVGKNTGESEFSDKKEKQDEVQEVWESWEHISDEFKGEDEVMLEIKRSWKVV